MKISLKTDKETLLKLLKDSDFNKKLKVLNKLHELSESDQIKILLKILEDSSWYLREQATKELAQFGSKIAPRLKKLCSKGFWYTRAAACRTLGEICELDATETILKLLLTDDNPTVLKEAKTAIKKIAEKNGENFLFLIKHLKIEQKIDAPACSILIECLPEQKTKLKEIFEEKTE
ncbi:MAG: HEAT repeat domain-containing protein [bacterium]